MVRAGFAHDTANGRLVAVLDATAEGMGQELPGHRSHECLAAEHQPRARLGRPVTRSAAAAVATENSTIVLALIMGPAGV